MKKSALTIAALVLSSAFAAEPKVTVLSAIRAEINRVNPGRCSKPSLGKVGIGDHAKEVQYCGWGAPSKINRTRTAGQVTEQWVYSGGYLYFTDDILTTIQN